MDEARATARAKTGAQVRLPAWLGQPGVVLFLVNLFLLWPVFFPGFREINPWDEAAYINAGRALVDAGEVPGFAGNPLIALIYAVPYFLVRGSPFWLIYSDWFGRLLAFGLLWLAAYLVGRELPGPAAHLAVPGLFMVTPLAAEILSFPSDPYFVALAGLAFWRLLRFERTRQAREAAWASAFLGLAALARNDGLVLFPILAALLLLMAWRRERLRQTWLPALAPYVAIVGGFVLGYGLMTGDFRLGTMARTYDNFEAGQQVVLRRSGEINPVIEAKLEARRLFGTPEENNYSVFRAILRNPSAYLARLKAVAGSLPSDVLRAYGVRFAAPLFLLALRGIVALGRQRRWILLAAFLLWPMHLASGFVITLFRIGHLQFPFFVVYGLAAVGLGALLKDLQEGRGRRVWVGLLGALALYGWLDSKLAIFYGASVVLVASLAGHYLATRLGGGRAGLAAALLALLAGGMVLRGGYPSPRWPTIGATGEEQAVVFMTENLPRGSLVAAATPGPVLMARMRYAGLTATDVPLGRSPEAFLAWMRSQGIVAVYVDRALSGENPRLWGLIQPLIGSGLERVFLAEDGDIQVLLVR